MYNNLGVPQKPRARDMSARAGGSEDSFRAASVSSEKIMRDWPGYLRRAYGLSGYGGGDWPLPGGSSESAAH